MPRGRELVERDREVAQLGEAIAKTPQSNGGVVVIEGPAGIGKTRLLEAGRELAEEGGLRVAWARASELERDYGFGVVRQLLDPLAITSAESSREELFTGAAALAAPLFQREGPLDGPSVEPDYATLHGLYWLLAGLAAERPLAICVDDVQWADPPSLRFLSFAARRIENLAVAVLATLRTGETGSDPELVSQLVTESGVLTLRPQSLTESGVGAIAREELAVEPSPGLVEACLESTGGNPFFLKALLSELARSNGDLGPEAVRRVTEIGSEQISTVLMRRLEALPAGARELASAVSVLGDGTEIGSAARLADLDLETAEDGLHSLVAAAVLAERDGIGFTHPIVRSSVYSSLSPSARSDLHRRAAQQLQQDGARVEEIAQQLLHANPGVEPDAVPTLREAADRSLALGAPESAAGFLARALLEPLEASAAAEILLELGRAEMRAGLPGGPAHLEQVMKHPEASAVQRGLAALDLGEFYMHALRRHEGIPVLEAGLAETREAEPDLAKRIEATLIFNAFGNLTTRRQLLERLHALKPPTVVSTADPARLLFAALAFDQAMGAGTARAAIDYAEQCLSYSGPMEGSTEGTAMALALVGMAAADRADLAERHADQILAFARAMGSIFVFALMSAERALVRWRLGDLPGAEADARAVIAIEGYPGLEVLRPVALAAIVSALTERGELAAAEATAQSIDREEAADTPTWQLLLEAIVDLRLAEGEAQQAVKEAKLFPHFEAEWGAGPSVGYLEWRWRAAAAYSAVGDEDAARAIADEQLSLAEHFGSARALGIALRTCALREPEPERIEMLRQAVDHLPRDRSALERARTLVELGAALRRKGHRAEAREPLQEALELGRDCGALRLAKRAHTELRAAGARPRSPLRTGLDALTPSERRVAEMAADGATNAEVAQSLFVTVKTIEMHLSNAYRKLEISSRSQLRNALRSGSSGELRSEDDTHPILGLNVAVFSYLADLEPIANAVPQGLGLL